MIISRARPYTVFKRVTSKDNEGGTNTSYVEKEKAFRIEIWPAGGRVQVMMYGERLRYMMNAITDYDNELYESDGVAIETDDHPDYRVVSKSKYSNHIVYELEKIIQ